MNLKDNDGNTALHYCETIPLAQLLVQHGADVCAANYEGLTPADVALEEGYEEVVQYFVSLGAPVPQPRVEEGEEGDGEDMDEIREEEEEEIDTEKSS